MSPVVQEFLPGPFALGGADQILNLTPGPLDGMGEVSSIARGTQSTMSADLSEITSQIGMRRTMEGGSTLTLELSDPNDSLIESPLISSAWTMRVGELSFETVQRTRNSWESWTVTLEDEMVMALKAETAVRHAERGKLTRAQFAQMVAQRALDRVGGTFFCPELRKRQREAKPEQTDTTTADERKRSRSPGINTSQKLKIKGVEATPAQLRQVDRALRAAATTPSNERSNIAMLCGGIGESGFEPIMNTAGSPYGGVFQGKVRGGPWDINDTEGMAKCFQLGGKGFQGGGAIALTKAHPDWGPGRIAVTVEGSGSNFPNAQAAEHHYGQYEPEAKALWAAFGGGTGTAAGTGEQEVEKYTFRQGEPGKPARAWDTLGTLADEVQWRRWAVGVVLFFMAEEDLIRSRPRGVIAMRRDQEGLTAPPSVDLDDGKPNDTIQVPWIAPLWDAPPGTVVLIERSGKMDGRWIVSELDRPDLRDPDVTVTLKRPDIARPEPAPELKPRTSPTSTRSSGGAGGLTSVTPSGAFQGTKGVFDQYIHPFMRKQGLSPGSQKRSKKYTSSGNISDHWEGLTNSWACDYPTFSGEGKARALADSFGWTTWSPNSWNKTNVTIGGKRFILQILWGAAVEHGDHVHVGLRAL